MSTAPDYKAAYEALMNAVDQANRIIGKAQIVTSYQLSIQQGEPLTDEDLQNLKALKTDNWDSPV